MTLDPLIHKNILIHILKNIYIERLGKTNRDIFDTWFFLKNSWPINEKIIKMRTELSMKQFLQKCINELDAMSNIGILSGLGELLSAKQKAWVKKSLKDETVFLLKVRLESL